MSTDYPPLPPPGLRLKLQWARKRLRQLIRTFDRYIASDPSRWSREIDQERAYYLYRLHFETPPDAVSFMADEAVHHLRTALDHLVTALVEAEGRNSANVAFPILRSKPITPKAISAYEGMISGISNAAARNLIDSVQPYHRGDAANRHPLWVLNRLDNRFKHTTLQLFTLAIHAPDVPGAIRRSGSGLRPLQSGDVFARIPTNVNVSEDFEPRISTTIAFDQSRIGVDQIGINEVYGVYNFIRDEVMRKVLRGRLRPRLPPLG